MISAKTTRSLLLVFAFSLTAACSSESPAPAAESADAETTAGTEAAVAAAFPTAPLLDPNTASAKQLAAVPGMSPSAVEAVLAARPLASSTELDAALAAVLDDATRAAVYAHVFVKVGLNSGAEADYKLIPSSLSAGKLAHEFEEYRPYESLEDFSREMAKYVDDAEVAHLTRYVTLD